VTATRRDAAGRGERVKVPEAEREVVYRFEPGKGVTEELVAFHCKPTRPSVVDKFTMTVRHEVNAGYVLTKFQFAGDTEAHGVPLGR
jgi:hypothetical protein